MSDIPMFDSSHCLPGYWETNLEGKVLVLRADVLDKAYRTAQNQLWLAQGGFGCQAGSSGRAVFAASLADGAQARWNRADFVGVLQPEHLPDWARDGLRRLGIEPEPQVNMSL